MFVYEKKYSVIYKAITMALVCLFCANSVVLADPNTLAPLAGNPKVYQEMRDMVEARLIAHQDPIDESIKQNVGKAKNLSSIPYLEEEFAQYINDCGAKNMLTRLKTTLIFAGGKIQVIFVKSEDELPVFYGERAWGHAGTYVTAFALESEKDSGEGRRKIIARLFHEIRARSTRAKELFDEELKNKTPATPEEISAFISSARKEFEKVNLQIQQEIEQNGRITSPLLSREFANLTFAIHPHVINRDYMMGKKMKRPVQGSSKGNPDNPVSELPKYGNSNFWPGKMKLTSQDLVNLGVRASSWSEDWVFANIAPLFKDAPAEVQGILKKKLSNPYRTHKEILKARQSLQALLYIAGFSGDKTKSIEKLNRLISLIKHYYELQEKYYKELYELRSYHYPYYSVYSKRPRSTPQRFNELFPDVTCSLIALGQIVITLQAIDQALPENSSEIIQRWKDKIQKTLARPELKPFLEKKKFLEAVSSRGINPYVFVAPDTLEKHKDSFNYQYWGDRWDGVNIEDMDYERKPCPCMRN